MYVDIECILKGVDLTDAPQNSYEHYKSFAIAHYLHSRKGNVISDFKLTGPGCIKYFAIDLLEKA